MYEMCIFPHQKNKWVSDVVVVGATSFILFTPAATCSILCTLSHTLPCHVFSRFYMTFGIIMPIATILSPCLRIGWPQSQPIKDASPDRTTPLLPKIVIIHV